MSQPDEKSLITYNKHHPSSPEVLHPIILRTFEIVVKCRIETVAIFRCIGGWLRHRLTCEDFFFFCNLPIVILTLCWLECIFSIAVSNASLENLIRFGLLRKVSPDAFVFQVLLSQLWSMTFLGTEPSFDKLLGCLVIFASVCTCVYFGPEKESEWCEDDIQLFFLMIN